MVLQEPGSDRLIDTGPAAVPQGIAAYRFRPVDASLDLPARLH